jgi:3-hydroxyacyl-CoA dehydrogenase
MSYEIKKAAVLGAGVMGAAIAAHLANAGIECLLLDILPPKLTKEDEKKGLTRESPAWRNSFAQKGLDGAKTSKPASFYASRYASRIEIGNFEDHLSRLAGVDWVIEAVIENLQIKQDLFARVANVVKPHGIVSTNTSGIRIEEISAGFSEELKERFLGTHFFNPPRYMKLMEIIPGKETKPELIEFMTRFSEDRLGKGIVICKDVPNFIANRIGVFDMSNAMNLMTAKDMTVEQIDAILGTAVGRPRTAIFGTIDLVGLDTAYHVMKNLYDALPEDEKRDLFMPPDFVKAMIEKKWLGNKTRQGFYRKTKDVKGKSAKLYFDYKTQDYVPVTKPRFESISSAKEEATPADRVRKIFAGTDAAADLVREYLCNNFIYAANRIPEICNGIYEIDCAMRWGYNHELGPFELWDAVGVRNAVDVMKALKKTVPEKVLEMLRGGFPSFYSKKEDGLYCYDFAAKGYIKIKDNPKIILLSSLKERKKIIRENAGASLVDIGDGVACLEFHTKMNAIDDDVIRMMFIAADIVEKDHVGLVIGNQGSNFSAGANLFKVLIAIQKADWDILEKMVGDFQNANMRMKYLSKPVVAAPAALTLGGGCEVSMHGACCQACGETYIGLVEVGVGVIPAGGGTKELMVRVTEGIYEDVISQGLNLQSFYGKVFETIGMAKVATSAVEAKEFGYLRKTDGISLNRDQQLYDAKEVVLGLSRFYKAPPPSRIPVMGENLRGICDAVLFNMRHGNFVSDYDVHIARKLAYILSGGDCPEGTYVTEQEILDLEREAFISLCGETKTQDRIMAMLKTGKPLRN